MSKSHLSIVREPVGPQGLINPPEQGVQAVPKFLSGSFTHGVDLAEMRGGAFDVSLGMSIISTTSLGRLDITGASEPHHPSRSVTAQLPLLPPPLGLLHGPLLVSLHYWNDTVEADFPACALTGEGETDTAALEDLGQVMLDWAQGVAELGEDNLGGALLRQWQAFKAMVDVSKL